MTSSLFVNVRAAAEGIPYSPCGLIVAIDGTAYPGAPFPSIPITDDGNGWWAGFSSGMVGGLANVQDGLWASAIIGYPAAITPMWPSVQLARGYGVQAIKAYADGYQRLHGTLEGLVIGLTGYSQGAMATDQIYTEDFLSPNGVLNYLLPFLYRVYNYGDPFRTPGIAHGNELAGLSLPTNLDGVVTGGIGGALDLTPAQSNMLAPDGKFILNSCANNGDIYACCPVGPDPQRSIAAAGEVGNGIFKVIMQATFFDIVAIAKDLFHPIGTVEEIYNGLKFAAQGTQAPHWQYFPQMDACITDLLELGNSLPHEGC